MHAYLNLRRLAVLAAAGEPARVGSGRRRMKPIAAVAASLGALALTVATVASSAPLAGASAKSASKHAKASGSVSFLSNCSKPDIQALANVKIPSSLMPDLPAGGQIKEHDTVATWGGTSSTHQTPSPFTAVKITPAEATKICKQHLKAVFLNWSNVVYNKAIVNGIRDEFNAVGVKLIRVTTSSFSATGLSGNVNAVMPLNPDIVLAGGTINPSQMASLMSPVISAHKILVSWGNDGPGLKLGPKGQLQGLIGYDWYFMGEQMAKAIHDAYPNGANLGYIHWINDNKQILLRENGLLAGLKKYSNIHVVTANGGAADPAGTNSGFSTPTATSAEQYTESFLQTHSTVNVLFAPWENPPGLGEQSAINALHLQTKVHIATMDLGTAGVTSLSNKGTIVVDMAEDVYIGGRMMAATAALDAIHANHHPFVIIPTEAATPSNFKTAWKIMHGPALACPC